jgi:hypothetical protein
MAELNPAMEARPRPISGAGRQTVSDRIMMDVIGVSLEIIFVFVANRVLPKPALPNSAATFTHPRGSHRLLGTIEFDPTSGELTLQPAPPARVITIARW